MADAIEANYVQDGDDWTITVSGRGRELSATAPGIIAARDRTDQLVEELVPNEKNRTVVHLLNGDALEFTTAYLTARMAKPEPRPDTPRPDTPEAEREPEQVPEEESAPAPRKPSPRPREREPEPDAAARDEVNSPN